MPETTGQYRCVRRMQTVEPKQTTSVPPIVAQMRREVLEEHRVATQSAERL